MESRLLLNVVIRESATVLQLLSGKDKTLLVGWDSFLVLNLRLHVVDGVRGLDLESDGLSSEGFYEDLHTSTETKDKVKSGFLLDVVIRKGATVLELLSGEDQTLLVGWDTLLVLDLGLDVVNGIRGFDLESDGLSSEGLDENLHSTTETENEMEGGLFLDIVVRESATVLKLLSGEDETLLVGWDTLLVLDLGLHVVDGVRRLDLESDGFTGEGLDEDLHTSTETEDEMEGGLLLDVIVRKGTAILKLLSSEDETLLVGWDALLILDFGFNVINGIRGFDLESDGLSGKSLYEDLHDEVE